MGELFLFFVWFLRQVETIGRRLGIDREGQILCMSHYSITLYHFSDSECFCLKKKNPRQKSYLKWD